MQLTIRFGSGEVWTSYWDETPVACGHADMTDDERDYEQITSFDDAAAKIEDCIFNYGQECDAIVVWRHDPHPGDVTGPVMKIVVERYAERAYRAASEDEINLRNTLPQSTMAFLDKHGADDLEADVAAEYATQADEDADLYRMCAGWR